MDERRTTRVLRSDDPTAAELLARGWSVAAESWGARLRLPSQVDPAGLRALVDAARGRGYDVVELGDGCLAEVAGLEERTADDYPLTPATAVPPRTPERLAEMTGVRFFGARLRGSQQGGLDGGGPEGELVAVTATEPGDGLVETAFTSVHPDHRRRGLAVAVKAASVIAHVADGVRLFGTGGAAVNAGSLAMNATIGYVVEERWLSLVPPPER